MIDPDDFRALPDTLPHHDAAVLRERGVSRFHALSAGAAVLCLGAVVIAGLMTTTRTGSLAMRPPVDAAPIGSTAAPGESLR